LHGWKVAWPQAGLRARCDAFAAVPSRYERAMGARRVPAPQRGQIARPE
jgi:hypothetical protein